MDLVGEKSGRLVVTAFSHRDKEKQRTYYKCLCDCGNTCTVAHSQIRSQKTKSCGCLVKINSGTRTHGKVGTKAYKTWKSIKGRCFKEYADSYYNYGAIGISLAPEYVDSFEAFYKEVGDPPDDEKRWSIDRIDNCKGYIERNMRWVDDFAQARNKSRQSNNSTGVTGVCWQQYGRRLKNTYASATWKDPVTHKTCNKKFSVKMYGLLEAFKLAVDYRTSKINEFNNIGAGYAENHGKDKVVS